MKLRVELGERGYDIICGYGVRHELAGLIAERAPRAQRALVVTAKSLRGATWCDVQPGVSFDVIEIPDGEASKTREVYFQLVDEMASRRLSRHDVVVAVGGGATTDVVGFAAATYLRGVSLVNISTTVAGQVDAAIGGKTGVNLDAGKNLLGAFHQPIGVLCDLETLETLSERDRTAGMGEVVKAALLEGRTLDWFTTAKFEELLEMAIALKARIVSGDEREGDQRVLLNYGHTLAHALERRSLTRGEGSLRHGEAVAVGLAFAARLARRLELVDDTLVREHDEFLREIGLPTRVPDFFDTEELIESMKHDKKAHHDLSFVLAGPGGFSLVSGIDESVVRDTLERFRREP